MTLVSSHTPCGNINIMITIQELHRYYKLSQIGAVEKILCPSDPDHTPMLPNVEDDEPIMFCLGCKSKLRFGENLSNIIKSMI